MIQNTSVRQTIGEALALVFFGNTRADNALHFAFAGKTELTFEDRGICAEYVYGITRYWRLLWEVIGSSPSETPESFEKLISAYAILMNKTDEGSAPDESMGKKIASARSRRVLRESIPDWLDERGERELGKIWDTTIASLNESPHHAIRVNTLKAAKEELMSRLARSGLSVRAVDQVPSALIMEKMPDLFRLEEFKNGLFEVQDCSSQLASLFINPEPGMRVIDACAGGGGKTLHIAALMQNRGKIVALDTDERKLAALQKRATKAGVRIIETRCITSTKTIKRLDSSAKILILDVPCSGTGVLRRNPDIKWRLTQDALARLIAEQKHILSYYTRMVKPGGRVLYSNCSVLGSEGEDQIRSFLNEKGSDFTLLKEKRIDPRDDHFDGFYMAVLERKTQTQA
jgi:16S rRNA (cytosine967-C5)-methyltransferase